MKVEDPQENYSTGWIKIYRSIKGHWVFQNAEYFKAWIDILISVNISDKKTMIKGELIECKRGQSVMSIRSWAEEFGFGWSVQRVRTFFSLLEKEGMLVVDGLKYTTRISVCNYDSYQSIQLTDNKLPIISELTDNTLLTTTKEVKEVKKRIMAWLNEKSNKGFEDTEKNHRLITARLNEGRTEQQIKDVITHKCKEWSIDEKMKKYMRPETLFGSKFEGYLQDLPKKEIPFAERFKEVTYKDMYPDA